MKHSKKCPKCDWRYIWIIRRYAMPDGEGSDSFKDGRGTGTLGKIGKPMHLVQNRGLNQSVVPYGRLEPFRCVGSVDLFICANCGFSEFWSHGFQDLVADPKEGIELMEPEKGSGGYR